VGKYDKNRTEILTCKFYSGNESNINIFLGFKDGFRGIFILDNVKVYENNEDPVRFHSQLANYLRKEIGLESFNEENYYNNILAITRYVNSLLIGPYIEYYKTKSPEKQRVLDSLNNQRREHAKFFMIYPELHHLIQYLNLPVEISQRSYCTRSSYSVAECLFAFGIGSHQIHFSESGTGFHQFLEYWNPYDKKWYIIDPSLGIEYRDLNGNLLGYDEIIEMRNNIPFNEEFVQLIDIGRHYFKWNSIRKGWNTDIIRRYYLFETMSYPN
jgi:hypothetical protein